MWDIKIQVTFKSKSAQEGSDYAVDGNEKIM
jgi:hypothetical protein